MNLKDPAIKINDSLTENKIYRGQLSHFIYGTLTYTPTHCPLCDAENKEYSIVKNGTKENTIKWLPLTHTPTYFVLKKHKNHIANTFQSPNSNGPLEGTISKIKALNRIAFGYRSFSSFKRRILLACRTTQKAA